jgi:hypothetical protein
VVFALAVTVVIVFARDIQRYAHGTATQQRSQNTTFKSLSSALLEDENAWGDEVASTVSGGAALTRAELSTQLDGYRMTGTELVQRARILSTPELHGDVQAVLEQVTEERVSAIDLLIGDIAGPLQLPNAGSGAPVSAIQHAIVTSNEAWRSVRLALRYEPGGVVLARSRLTLGTAPLTSQIAALVAAPSLAPTRLVTIAALSVAPAPLPASVGLLHLVPTFTLRAGVSVTNLEWIVQPATVTVTIRPLNGRGRATSAETWLTVGPQQSAAGTFRPLAVEPGERAVMTVVVGGAPSSGSRTYQLFVAPS